MRVGVLQKAFDGMRDSEKPVYAQALADLRKAGVTLTTVDFDENLPPIRFLLEAEGAAAFDDITRDGQIRSLKGQTAGSWPNTFRSARLTPAVEYIRAQRARTLPGQDRHVQPGSHVYPSATRADLTGAAHRIDSRLCRAAGKRRCARFRGWPQSG
jgi:hypothetical protein